MKFFLCGFVVSLFALVATAQEMQVKQFNFTSFHQDQKRITQVLDKASSAQAKKHPEYGILPYNAPCSECVELIDERTVDTRKFIDPTVGKTVYLDKSYFPFHYKKSENDIWRTIDTRLRPDAANPGVYIAPNQPAPTQCNLNTKTTTISNGYMDFVFNKNLSLYFFDEGSAYTATEKGNYSDYTVGEEGMQVKNVWPGIDMQQVFRTGEIETRYVITAPLALSIDKGWMVIEDHFTLPAGFTFEEKEGGERLKDGSFKGDYAIKNEKGQPMFKYEKPVYFDAMAFGMQGSFKVIKNGNDYTLQMFVPVSWLNKKENLYPLYIDPTVTVGDVKQGDFRSTMQPGANFAYTSMALGSCNYTLTMSGVPLQLQFTDVYVNLEYQLTYDNTCAFNTIAPYCTFSQVTMEVVCNLCNTSTGKLSCNPANPPYTGTCTTDPNLVPGATALHYTAANYLPCYQPSCGTVDIPFTLKDQDSVCGDVCGYLCARGNKLEVTIEACTVNGTITQDKTSVCTGQPVTFTVTPACGVPPYHYIWVNGNQQDTIYGANTYTINPQQSVNGIFCYIFDTCNTFNTSNANNFGVSNSLNVAVGPPPPINLFWKDTSLCQGLGGTLTLGGNPTTNAPTVLWTGSNQTAQNWLGNQTASMNPVITVPQGTIGGVYFVVTASNPSCATMDTQYVFSDTISVPVITAGGPTTFCAGQSVTLSTTSTDSVYSWSNPPGGSGSSLNVTQSGQYQVTVTSQDQCTAISNTIPVNVLPAPSADAGGPFNLCQGGTITLGGNPTTSAGTSVVWTTSDPTAQTWLSADTVFNPTVTVPPTSAGTFYYVLIATGASNCSSTDTAIVNAYLDPQPVIDSSGPTKFCLGNSVVLTVTGSYASYLWNDSMGTANAIKVSQTGQFDVTVTDQNNCTGLSNVIPVLVTNVAAFQVYPDTLILYGDSVLLSTNANLSSASVDSFTWYPAINISCLVCDNPIVAPLTDQFYGLIIYASGCSAADSALIRIIYPDNFFIPNAFTPNGDGNNDNFYIATQPGVKVLLFQVFDRWGEKVHEGDFPWDGTYRSKPAPPGVYTYLFKLELYGEQRPIYRKGTVNLIR